MNEILPTPLLFRTMLHNPAVVLTYATNTVLDRPGDLQLRRTRHYSDRPSSVASTRCDEDNQVFLAMHCDHLRGSFISPRSISVIIGNSGSAPGETI